MSYGPHPGQPGGHPPQGGYPPPQGFGGPQQFQQGNFNQGPPQGHPLQGYPQQGFPSQGPPQGYPQQGLPQSYPPQGPPQGYHPQGAAPQQGWGQPPPGPYPQPGPQQWAPPASSPSPGYVRGQQAQGDASRDADALRSAMKGFGTNENQLIQVLSKPDPLQINLLRNTYNQRHRRDLEKDIHSETSKYFRDGLLAIVRGPLMQDVHIVHHAVAGIGTKESALNDVLLGRSNADMRAIKQAYHQEYHKTLEADVKEDLSLKTEQLFSMVMAANRAEESAPVLPHEVDRDVTELHHATEARSIGKDQITVCSIISSRSDGQIRAIAHAFQQKYHKSLQEVMKKKFDGHMEDALLLMIDRACDKTMTDAVQLEDAMKGMGTKDELLVNRIVRIHWDRAHMDQVKRAYQHRFKKDLISRVTGEVSGDYKSLMVACLT